MRKTMKDKQNSGSLFDLVADATAGTREHSLTDQEAMDTNWYRILSQCFSRLKFVLRQKKRADDVTQKSIAQRIGKDEGYISRALSGRKNVTMRTLSNIAYGMDMRMVVDFVDIRAANQGCHIHFRDGKRAVLTIGPRDEVRTTAPLAPELQTTPIDRSTSRVYNRDQFGQVQKQNQFRLGGRNVA
tara:strand:+ start:3397 stop:3954 length:558 start_codon:yes stop_codon:yes gene_type:complete